MTSTFLVPAGNTIFIPFGGDFAFVVPAEINFFEVTEAIQMSCNNPCAAASACCIGTVSKRTVERVPIVLDWSARIESMGGGQLLGLTVEITKDDGSALAGDPADLAIAAVGDDVCVTTDRRSGISKVWVEAGADDVDYRVNMLARIKDCEGCESLLHTCVAVSVKDC